MKRKTKLLLAALAVCVLAAAVAAASLTVSAANEKTGTFNGSPADVDEAGNLLLNSTNEVVKHIVFGCFNFHRDVRTLVMSTILRNCF